MRPLFSNYQLMVKLVLTVLLLAGLVVFYQAWHNWQSLLIFAGAYLLGAGLLWIDEQYLYQFYQEKIDVPGQEPLHFPRLITRNLLFLLSLPLLSLFLLTSSGSLPGIALVLSLNFYLLVEMWQLRREYLLFKDRFLEMANIKVSAELVKQICYGATLYFGLLLIKLLI